MKYYLSEGYFVLCCVLWSRVCITLLCLCELRVGVVFVQIPVLLVWNKKKRKMLRLFLRVQLVVVFS